MIAKIKRLVMMVNAVLIALLLGLLAWFRLRLSAAQQKVMKKERDDARAVTEEVQRRHQAEQDVIAQLQVELSQALDDTCKRDYFENGKW